MEKLALLGGTPAIQNPPEELFAWPIVTKEDEEAVLHVVRNNRYSYTEITKKFQEEFAEYMGGRDDIWYATNIEIYDYIDAYKKLIFSADGHTIYNPTAKKLYFASGNKSSEFVEYSIEPDQTIQI